MKKKADEPVVIRIEVRKGKEVLFASVVPDDVGLQYEFPKALPLGFGKVLAGIDVVPHVADDPEAIAERRDREERLRRGKPNLGDIEAVVGDLDASIDGAIKKPKAQKWFDGLFGRPVAEVEETKHRHEAKTSTLKAFNGCVAPDDCMEAAHGNTATHDTCACGATRITNINGRFTERSAWIK